MADDDVDIVKAVVYLIIVGVTIAILFWSVQASFDIGRMDAERQCKEHNMTLELVGYKGNIWMSTCDAVIVNASS